MSGTVVISYDDGHTTDYTLAFPVHQRYGVPGEVGMPSSYVGTQGRLGAGELLELQASGWVIASHTKHHISLSEEPLTQPARKCDDRIYLARPGRYRPGVELRLSHGRSSGLVKVADVDKAGGYLTLERGLPRDFGRRSLVALLLGEPPATVTLSPAQADEEIRQSRRELESLGLEVRHFTYPYARFCSWTHAIVKECYDTARAGRSRSPSYDIHAIPSTNFERVTDTDRIAEALDDVACRGGLCLFHAHTSRNGFTPETLEQLIVRCLERGLTISTRSAYFSRN